MQSSFPLQWIVSSGVMKSLLWCYVVGKFCCVTQLSLVTVIAVFFIGVCDWLMLHLCSVIITVCTCWAMIGQNCRCVQPICLRFIQSVKKSSTRLFTKMTNTSRHSGTTSSLVTASFGIFLFLLILWVDEHFSAC